MSGAKIEDGHLSLSGKQLKRLPVSDSQKYGEKVLSLDLTDNQMIDLSSLAYFTNMTDLILDKNQIQSLDSLPSLPNLETLWLNNNNITNLEEICTKIAEKCPCLSYLSMLKNPGCPDMYFGDGTTESYKRYRYYAIHCIPTLDFLDSTPVTDEERLEAKRVGKYMKVAMPQGHERQVPATSTPPRLRNTHSPDFGPDKAPSQRAPFAFLAKGKVRYDGNTSEGNRYIQNDDL